MIVNYAQKTKSLKQQFNRLWHFMVLLGHICTTISWLGTATSWDFDD